MRKLLTILFFLPCILHATKVWVNQTSGSDGNNGTAVGTPIKTLAKLATFNLTAGDSVFLNRGDIWNEQLKLTKTGSLGNPIYYGPYGTGADPIITGYIQLTTWVSLGGGIYSAAAPEIKYTARNFLLDGTQRTLARYPNSGFLTYTSSTTTSITDPTLTGTPNYTGAHIIVRSSHFTYDTATVSGQSVTVLNLASNLSYTGAGGTGYLFYGQDQWLDSAGEWCPNNTLDSVHVYFGGGGPSGHTAYISTMDTTCIATGAYISVKSLHFIGANRYTVFNPFGTGSITFSSCLLEYGYNGMYMFTPNVTILNTKIQYMLNNGIAGTTNGLSKYMKAQYDTLRQIGTIAGMGNSGNLGDQYGIINNADSCDFSYNEIDTIGYMGIRFGGAGTKVKYNHIKFFCSIKDDGGGIYAWETKDTTYANGREVVGNFVEDGQGAPAGVAYDQASAASGGYLDTRASDTRMDSNTFINNVTAGIFFHGKNNLFRYNRCYGNKYAQLFQSEFTGQPITGTVIKWNSLASPDSTIPAIRFMTPGTDIATMGVCDSNYIGFPTGAVNAFHTKSSGDAGTLRSFASWQAITSGDAHGTYQTGRLSFAGNTAQAPLNYYRVGKYQELPGTINIYLIPLSGTQGKILLELDKGYITVPAGTKIIPR